MPDYSTLGKKAIHPCPVCKHRCNGKKGLRMHLTDLHGWDDEHAKSLVAGDEVETTP